MKNKLKGVFLLLSSIVIISGCSKVNDQYTNFIEKKAEDSSNVSEVTTQEKEQLVDIRLVPELIQVEDAIKKLDKVEVGDEIYRLQTPILQSQEAFDIAVNQMVIYEAQSDDSTLGLKSKNNDEGAIVICNVSITNKSKETFYFPIEELRLTYPTASVSHYANSGLYPLETGNLYQILLNDENGAISPSSAVEGYLVYSLTSDDLDVIKEEQAFNLTVVPPRTSADEIIGLSSANLGYELPLFLPFNEAVETELVSKSTQVQDRISAEWWGTKNILADQIVDESQTDSNVKFTLKRIEISDFTSKPAFEESFQYFPNGQVIVSVEIEIDNQSEFTLLPIDSIINLVINEDTIQSDYILINELYGKHLKPGEKTTIIKSYALDKSTYQQNWQGLDMQIYAQVYTDKTVSEVAATLEETTTDLEQVEQVEEFVTGSEANIVSDEISDALETSEASEIMFVGNFVWTPILKQYIDENLEVVDKLTVDTETTIETDEALSEENSEFIEEETSIEEVITD